MNESLLSENWALWAAVLPALVVLAAVSWTLRRNSAAGQLNTALRDHRRARRQLSSARRALARAQSRLERLEARAEKTKPRLIEEARSAVLDTEALEKIAADKTLVTVNFVRKVIFEEYPPSRHEALRRRFLAQDVADSRPFIFGG